MGFPGKLKFPIISNDFANCGHKGELTAVVSAIYYLNNGEILIWPPDYGSNVSKCTVTLVELSQIAVLTQSPDHPRLTEMTPPSQPTLGESFHIFVELFKKECGSNVSKCTVTLIGQLSQIAV